MACSSPTTVWRAGFDASKGQPAFAKLLVETGGTTNAGLGYFGGFRTDRGRIDIKKAGLFGLVSTARALAVCHHVVERARPREVYTMHGFDEFRDHLRERGFSAHAVTTRVATS